MPLSLPSRWSTLTDAVHRVKLGYPTPRLWNHSARGVAS
jgi:hypothetical protein